MTTLFGVIAIISLVVFLYPYLIYPIILKCLPEKKVLVNEGGGKVSASFLFCAFNEESVIEEKIENIKKLCQKYKSIEVLAYDDGSTDNTLNFLRQHQDLITIVRGEGRKGKAHGMKLLAGQARGDILVFTDANVLLDIGTIDNLFGYYSCDSVGGICGTLQYLGAGSSSTAYVGSAYWRLEEYLKGLESNTGSVMGADGSIFSIRRKLYPRFPDSVLDDLTVSMSVVFAGYRLIKADDVIAYERLVVSSKEEFSRKVRISTRAFHTHMFLRPQLAKMKPLDKFKYFSRKYIRWFGALFMFMSVASFLAFLSSLSMPLFLIAVFSILVGVALGLSRFGGPLSKITEVLLAVVATMLGVVGAIRGKTKTVWNPAKTR